MLDVLLINPYVLGRHEARVASYRPYPPLGLMYLGAVLREAGFTVEIYDGTFTEDSSHLRARLKNGPLPRVAGIFAMNSFRDDALETIRALSEHDVPAFAGGPDPSIYDEEYLKAGAEVVVRGEGEVALLDLLDAFSIKAGETSPLVRPDSQRILQIVGTSILEAGEIQRAPDRPASKTMDELPTPAYDLIDLPTYVAEWRRVHGYASIQFMTSRGCPFSCAWCARPIFGRRYRQYSPERAADEVAELVNNYGIDHLWLFDDTFVVRRVWVEKFCAALEAKKLDVRWECLARVDLVDRDLLERMKRAGVSRINFGFESGSQRVLDRMKKGITVADARRVAKDMHELGISMGGYVLMGYPGEEWEDIKKTIELLKDIQPVDYSTSVALPMPGTEFHGLVKGMINADHDWATENEDAVIWKAPYSRAVYRLIESLMHAEYDLGLEFDPKKWAKAKMLRTAVAALTRFESRGDRMDVYQSDRFKGWEGMRRPEHSARHRAGHRKKAETKNANLRVLS